jgi:HEAT repeat protein
MTRHLKLFALTVALSWMPILAQQVQPLPDALKVFNQEHDLTKKEHELLNITLQHPESGPAMLALAEKTQFSDTRWMAMRGMRDVQFRGCESFLKQELKNPDALVRANAARVIGDLGFGSADDDLLAMFVAEHDPGAVEQASLSLRVLNVRASAPLIRQKIPLFTGQTRAWLLQALGTLGDKSDIPFVASFLDSPDWASSMMAGDVLEQLAGLNFGPPQFGPQPLPPPRTLHALFTNLALACRPCIY